MAGSINNAVSLKGCEEQFARNNRKGNQSDLRLTSLPVSDQTPILHGTGGEIGNGNEINFGQRISDVEIILVEGQSFDGHV